MACSVIPNRFAPCLALPGLYNGRMIVISHLQKVDGATTLLEIETLTAAAGEITAVTGLIGIHKTTFLELLTGQIPPTAGTVRLAGIDPWHDRAAFARLVGVLTAENGLYPRLSARQNLTFFCDLYGLPHDHADAMLLVVGLQDQAKVQAEKLSPGLARRLAIGRAILHKPQVLLLVEPFAECDLASTSLLERLIRVTAAEGTAVLLISRDLAGLRPLCQTVVEMENGRVAQQYRPEERESQSNLPFKIPARLEDKVVLVNPADIVYVAAEEGRTVLCTPDGRVPTHLTLNEVEQRLARSGFFRAHRSYLVNVQHISEVIAYTRNSYTLILHNGGDGRIEIPLSKTAARDLREMLGY
ncbi:MAG: LytTR family transcriptional regulator DNA-binding domain-containing protein [Anaerolineae bacterium]|nr:LytTR family transcriptional regulator DNA-binding domain-containing protein [Anaerolineae bacterium]